jgi:hypothetical protein
MVKWFKDSSGHVLESNNTIHRLLFCPLCQKLISKVECEKLRQSSRDGNLYKVRRYYYDKSSKMKRAENREERQARRLAEMSKIELNKITKRMLPRV